MKKLTGHGKPRTRIISIYLLALIIGIGATTITLCVPAGLQAQLPVTITTNSDPGTFAFRLKDLANSLQTIKNTFSQIREAHQAVVYQAKMIEALKEGDLQGFANAMNYQTQAISQFGTTLDGFDYLKDNEKFAKLLKSDTFANLREGTRIAADLSGSATETLQSTNNLIKNAERRIKQSQQIQSQMAGADSVVTQLQLQQQGMGLVSSSINDLITTEVARNNFIAAQKQARDFQAEVDKKRINKLYKNKSHYRQIYTDKDFEDRLTGAEFEEGF